MKNTLSRNQLLPAIAGFVLLFLLGATLIFSYIGKAQQRDLRAWETMLGVVADTRQQDVDR